MVIPVELAGGALALARVLGLCATAPLLGDPDVPRGVRLGFALVVSVALAPLRVETLPALGLVDATAAAPTLALSLPALVTRLLPALAVELGLGLLVGAAARFALAAVEVAGHLASQSLGLAFAEQYDPRLGGSTDIGRIIARTLAALAFLLAGGLEALVRAAAQPIDGHALGLATSAGPAAAAAASGLAADFARAGSHALRLATSATSLGLGIAAPLVLAALVGNLAVALAHRAANAINVFTVGFTVSILAVCAAALVATEPMIDGVRAAAARAVLVLASGGAP